MILIALLLHKLGHYLPLWFSKETYKDLRAKFGMKLCFVEMNGVIMNLGLAFLIILFITLTTKDRYLLNENAIFGIECSDIAKTIGFENGDKIISINNKRVDRFSDILKTIVLAKDEVKVIMLRKDSSATIVVSNADKIKLIRSGSNAHISPKLRPDSVTGSLINYLTFSERKKGIGDAFTAYISIVKMNLFAFSPQHKAYENIGGFLTIGRVSKSAKGYLLLLAFSLIFLGLINLIPLPGLDAGNTIIALIEKRRKRKFNCNTLRIIRIVCSSLLVIVLLSLSLWGYI